MKTTHEPMLTNRDIEVGLWAGGLTAVVAVLATIIVCGLIDVRYPPAAMRQCSASDRGAVALVEGQAFICATDRVWIPTQVVARQ